MGELSVPHLRWWHKPFVVCTLLTVPCRERNWQIIFYLLLTVHPPKPIFVFFRDNFIRLLHCIKIIKHLIFPHFLYIVYQKFYQKSNLIMRVGFNHYATPAYLKEAFVHDRASTANYHVRYHFGKE